MQELLSIVHYPLSITKVFNPTRSQVTFFVAVITGLIIGKLIKNFKVGFMLAIVLGLLLAFNFKRRK